VFFPRRLDHADRKGNMEAPPQESRSLSASKNQSLLRTVNEELERLEKDWQPERLDLICECALLDCDEKISMTLQEYSAVRAHPARFLILAGHEIADVERVVASSDGYLIVEKVGDGGEFAASHDPRRDD